MYENIREYPAVMTLAHRSSKKRIISLGIILFCIFIIGFSLYGDGLVGLSDNGDFYRVMKPNRIDYTSNGRTPFAFQRHYTLSFEGGTLVEKLWNMLFTLKEPYHTTQNIFIKLSLLANTFYHALTDKNYNQYDIFWLGLLYFIAYVGAIGVIISLTRARKPYMKVIMSLLFIMVFCDVGYVVYFNSFYGEPLQMVTFLWIVASIIGVLSSYRKRVFYIVLFYLSVVFFAGAKYANIPQGMFLSACGLVFLCYYKGKQPVTKKAPKPAEKKSKVRYIDEERLKKRSFHSICAMRFLILSLFVLTLLICRLFYESVPDWMDNHTTYQSVFFGILKGSSTPQEDLEELGLPQKYSVLANTNAYMTGHELDIQSEEFIRTFYGGVTKMDILIYYLKNPGRFLEKLSLSCENSVHIRPVYLGNYDETFDRPKFRDTMGLWSRIRTYLPFNSLFFTFAVFILSVAILLHRFFIVVREGRYEPGTVVFLVFSSSLLIINAMNLAIPIIANGEADLAKHMFAFIMGFDLQFLGLFFWIGYRLIVLSGTLTGEFWMKYKSLGMAGLIITGLAIAFIAIPGSQPVKAISAKTQTGDVVTFGSLDGKPILWRVIDRQENTLQLFSIKPVTHSAYSLEKDGEDENRRRYGSNFWPESAIREWLNGDFMACFSPDEARMIQEHVHPVILSIADQGMATMGKKELFWTHVPSQSAFGAGEAYRLNVTDKVFLLDVGEYASLYTKGLERHPADEYWLETPYYNNSSMVRFVDREGYVMMKDATYTQMAVRPSIEINLYGQEAPLEADYDH